MFGEYILLVLHVSHQVNIRVRETDGFNTLYLTASGYLLDIVIVNGPFVANGHMIQNLLY